MRAQVIYANPAAEAHLQRPSGLALRHRVLSAAEPGCDADLKRLIHGASLGGVGKSISAGGLIVVPRSDARPLTVLVSPLSPGFLGSAAGAEPLAMIFIGDSESKRRLPRIVLSKLYKFSATEARLACALVCGETIRAYARQAGVSDNTARSQLKSIFAKTGHSRQSELIRDLASNPVLRMLQS